MTARDLGQDRRGTYFLFQGLLTAVLLLLFFYEYEEVAGWGPRFSLLAACLGASLVFLRLAPAELFTRWWTQSGLFIFDAGIASLTLAWAHPRSDFYLLFVLILFGTALSRSLAQCAVLGAIISLLYLASSWTPAGGLPKDSEFWLRLNFLWVSTFLLAVLSRDVQKTQREQERRYRERLVQVERMATLGRVAGEIAHRIKSPLTTILVNADILSCRDGRPREAAEEVSQIREAARHCQEILKNLLDLGRIEEMGFAALDLRAPVESALRSVEPQIRRKAVRLEVRGLDAPRMARGDASLLHEAVAAVIQNALDACAKGGTIRVRLEARRSGRWLAWRGGRESFAVVVEDDGKGIEPRDLERVFEPFFSTKGGHGTGLGLSAALRIMQKHRGTIEAASAGPGRGARFTLLFTARESRSGRAGRSAGRSR